MRFNVRLPKRPPLPRPPTGIAPEILRLFFHHEGHEDHEEPLLYYKYEIFVIFVSSVVQYCICFAASSDMSSHMHPSLLSSLPQGAEILDQIHQFVDGHYLIQV